MKGKRDKAGPGLLASLCFADIRHERLLSLCMLLSLAAVMAPILILFGLKTGAMDILRERLLQDPVNREIRPLTPRSYVPEWFDTLRSMPEVAFAVPATRQLSASADLSLSGLRVRGVSIVPSGPGDPLLLQNRCPAPSTGEAVITGALAGELGLTDPLAENAALTLHVNRRRQGVFEEGVTDLRVVCILPTRAGADNRAFVPLPLVEEIELYKDGMASPLLGGEGKLPLAYPVFSSLLLLAPQPLGPELELRLTGNTGFASCTPLTPEQAKACLPDLFDRSDRSYILRAGSSMAEADGLEAVLDMLAGLGVKACPLVEGLTGRITLTAASSGADTEPVPGNAFRLLPARCLEDSAEPLSELPAAPPTAARVFTVRAPARLPGGSHILRLEDSDLFFPVLLTPSADVPDDALLLPPALLGALGLAKVRPVRHSPSTGDFLLSRRGYAGFRLYASRLEDVAGLQSFFSANAIQVHTEAQRIANVLQLDSYLALVFWIIALASLCGGVSCLVSNIYAGIERKSADLAVLRLLGADRRDFILHALLTAMFFGCGGFAIACAVYALVSVIINGLFAAHLQEGESLCRLGWWRLSAALGAVFGLSLAVGASAARRMLRIDPAQALRKE